MIAQIEFDKYENGVLNVVLENDDGIEQMKQ